METGLKVLTVGHSNHEIGFFLDLLRHAGVTTLVDVRSNPYSRYCPWFSKPVLAKSLAKAGVDYVFMGEALGAKPRNASCYEGGLASFDKMAAQPEFLDAVSKVRERSENSLQALMCAEKDPLDCHRAILVGRRVVGENIQVEHLHADGTRETQEAFETRLLALTKLTPPPLFARPEDMAGALRMAYAKQGKSIAWAEEKEKETGAGVL